MRRKKRKRTAARPATEVRPFEGRRARLSGALDAYARELGEELARRAATLPLPLVRENFLELTGPLEAHYRASLPVFRELLRTRPQVHQIAGRYRAIVPGMDELVNTALVKWMTSQAGAVHRRDPLTAAAALEHLTEIFASLSALRLATADTGHALGEAAYARVQHPTSTVRALFGDRIGDHWLVDHLRERYVIGAVRAQLRPDADAYEMAALMAKAALEFSLNYFTAPALAEGVRAHLRDTSGPSARGRLSARPARQTRRRELLKEVLARLAPPAPGRLRPGAPWRAPGDLPIESLGRAIAGGEELDPETVYRRLARDVSPPRRPASPPPLSRGPRLRRSNSASDLARFK